MECEHEPSERTSLQTSPTSVNIQPLQESFKSSRSTSPVFPINDLDEGQLEDWVTEDEAETDQPGMRMTAQIQTHNKDQINILPPRIEQLSSLVRACAEPC